MNASGTPGVSLVIRCRDEERDLGRVLDVVLAQRGAPPFEVIALDSGSTDGTLALLGRYPVRTEHLPAAEFTYGHALNRGAALARGDLVVYLSAHCEPRGLDWLARLVAPFADAHVVAAFGRQIPVPHVNPIEAITTERNFPPLPPARVRFSTANGAVRRAAVLARPFDEEMPIAEDHLWACEVTPPHRIVYVPAAAVAHSHLMSARHWRTRFYAHGLATAYARHRRGVELPWGAGAETPARRARALLNLARSLARALELRALAYLPVYGLARTAHYARGLRDGGLRYGGGQAGNGPVTPAATPPARREASVRDVGLLPLLIAVAALGCRPDCAKDPGETRPNVVLVTIDTLRADHLGCYGNSTVSTPNLNRLAAEGALFLRAYAQTHMTVPSHLSIFSSLPMARHGVLTNGGVPPRPVEVLLPDLLARAGYRTAAFVSARHLGPGGPLGVALGGSFEVYRSTAGWYEPLRGDETTERFSRWLRKSCRAPFFAWIHYWDPHMPYAPPSPFDTMYYRGNPSDARHTSLVGVPLRWSLYDLDRLRHVLAAEGEQVRALKREFGLPSRVVKELLLRPEELQAYADGRGPQPRRRLGALAQAVKAKLPLHPPTAGWLTGIRDLRFPLARYAGEVSYVDAEIGRLVAELARLDLADRTIVVITADHGESLGEHGVYFDHFGLYEPNLRVPLIVWAPGRVAPVRREDLVCSLDLAPTILGLAGIPVPGIMQGRDLFATPLRQMPVFAELENRRQVMILDGSWKLIRTFGSVHYPEGFPARRGTTELYDLATDPDERNDVAHRHPDITRALQARLEAWDTQQSGRGSVEQPRWEEGLRALGYLQ